MLLLNCSAHDTGGLGPGESVAVQDVEAATRKVLRYPADLSLAYSPNRPLGNDGSGVLLVTLNGGNGRDNDAYSQAASALFNELVALGVPVTSHVYGGSSSTGWSTTPSTAVLVCDPSIVPTHKLPQRVWLVAAPVSADAQTVGRLNDADVVYAMAEVPALRVPVYRVFDVAQVARSLQEVLSRGHNAT